MNPGGLLRTGVNCNHRQVRPALADKDPAHAERLQRCAAAHALPGITAAEPVAGIALLIGGTWWPGSLRSRGSTDPGRPGFEAHPAWKMPATGSGVSGDEQESVMGVTKKAKHKAKAAKGKTKHDAGKVKHKGKKAKNAAKH
jgi:hypothetical protein